MMRPLPPLVISFVLGLVFSREAVPGYGTALTLILVSTVPLLVAVLRRSRPEPLVACPLFFALGALFILPVVRPQIPPNHVMNLISSNGDARPAPVRMEGTLYRPPEGRRHTTRLYVEARGIFRDGAWMEATGRILLYVDGPVEGLGSGDTVRFLARLRVPRNFGNPGGFDRVWWLKRKGILVSGYVGKGLIARIGGDGPGFAQRLGERTKRFIDSSGAANKGVMKALTTGDRSTIPDDVREVFTRSGTAHLLAISGLHVGFVAYLAYTLAVWLLKRSERAMLALDVRKAAAAASMVPVLIYGAVSGFSVSTERAVIMVGAYVFALLIGRARDLYSVVALAAFVILLADPGLLWDASFQLSFAAVLSILHLAPALRHLFGAREGTVPAAPIQKLKDRAVTLLSVTVAATIGTAPVLAYHFHRIQPVGFVSNLVVVPLTGFLAVPMCLVSALLHPLWQGGALWILRAADSVLYAALGLAGFFSGLPWASVWVSTPAPSEMVLFYLLLACLPFLSAPGRGRRVVSVLSVLAVLGLVAQAGLRHYAACRNDELTVTFISVGQGDAALVEFPSEQGRPGKTMLIDGGGLYSRDFDTGERVVAPFLWKKRIRRIDYIVLSHPQRDHMAGLEFIARNFHPEEFWWNGVGGLATGLEEALKEGGVRTRVVGAGTPPERINNVVVEFLHPHAASGLNLNNSSLVLRLRYGSRSFLFTGDIEEEAERMLAGRGVAADVIKVPHHGSRSSSTPRFVDSVTPAVAVASAGWMNVFGFPHEETVARYNKSGAAFLRTDLDGAVTVATDGEGLAVRTYLTGR